MVLKKIYILFCFFYRNLITYIQNLVFSKSKNQLLDKDMIFFSYKETNDLYEFGMDEYLYEKKNDYQSIFVLEEIKLRKLIKKILNKKFRDHITKKTGFVYSIDYFSFYRNFHIPENKMKSVYANFFHIDKPYSKNMLKIIIPIDVNNDDGPIVIKKSNPLWLNKKNYKNDFISLISNKNKNLIYGFYPSKCFHKASVPIKDKFCTQIMIQLNPADKWKINNKIFDNQDKQEPKFPELKNLFSSYREIY